MLSLVTTGTPAETIGLTAAKAHLRVSHDDDDAQIDAILLAAVGYIGKACGRELVRGTWRLALPSVSGDLVLPMPPVGAVSAISIYAPDGTDTALDVADFYLFASDDRATLRPKSGAWPAMAVRDDALRVTFTAGYVTPPPELVRAVMIMVSRDYDGLTGVDAVSYDRAIEAMTLTHRIGWVAA